MTKIFLVGFMGSGKTSIGRELANYLQYQFIDLDDLIVQQANLSINEIFSQYGEKYFRKLEYQTLTNIINYQSTVISLGGGAYVEEETRTLVNKSGRSIWLQCDLNTILSRLANDKSRPLNRSPEQMQQLLESRLFAYKQADIHINVATISIKDAAQRIAILVKQ